MPTWIHYSTSKCDLFAPPLPVWAPERGMWRGDGNWRLSDKGLMPFPILGSGFEADWTTRQQHPMVVGAGGVHPAPQTMQQSLERLRRWPRAGGRWRSWDASPDPQLWLLQWLRPLGQIPDLDSGPDLPWTQRVTSFFSEPRFAHLQKGKINTAPQWDCRQI